MNPAGGVSVVITCQNYGRFIGETLDSICAQTLPSREVLVIDNRSTDDTRAVVSRYAASGVQLMVLPARVWQSAARNVGVRLALGDYVAFVDADDVWLPRKLELQIERLDDHPEEGMVYCDVEDFEDDSGVPLRRASDSCWLPEGDVFRNLFLRNFVFSPSPVVRRSVLHEVGLWNESVQRGEDWDLWLRVAAKHRVGVVRQVLARRRVHRTAVSSTEAPWAYYREAHGVIERAVRRDPDRLGPLERRAVGNLAYGTGKRMLEQGAWAAARQMFWRAVVSNPRGFRGYGGLAVALAGNKVGGALLRHLKLGRFGRWLPV